MSKPKSRGSEDVPIAVVEWLKAFPVAITAGFLQAPVQTCIVHLVWLRDLSNS